MATQPQTKISALQRYANEMVPEGWSAGAKIAVARNLLHMKRREFTEWAESEHGFITPGWWSFVWYGAQKFRDPDISTVTISLARSNFDLLVEHLHDAKARAGAPIDAQIDQLISLLLTQAG